VKGLEKFREICKLGNFEPVYIIGKSEKLYENIDLFICCSELDAGPLGIFEAASCGVPVLTTAVGNVQHVKGIALFDTAQEAVARINSWNNSLEELQLYTASVTQEVRTNWSMDALLTKYLKIAIQYSGFSKYPVGQRPLSRRGFSPPVTKTK
jgi:glycosyltransferase involved in cell wall biosynthesis